MCCVKILIILAARAFNLAVIPRCECVYQLMVNTMFCSTFSNVVGVCFPVQKMFGKFHAVIRLNALHRKLESLSKKTNGCFGVVLPNSIYS